jgi:hypothetical protein
MLPAILFDFRGGKNLLWIYRSNDGIPEAVGTTATPLNTSPTSLTASYDQRPWQTKYTYPEEAEAYHMLFCLV